MAISHPRQRQVSLPAISDHNRSGFDVLSDKSRQRGTRCIEYHTEADSSGRPPADFDSSDNQSFILQLAPPAQACFRPAHIGLVNFDLPPQSFSVGPNHGSPQLLQHRPCRFIADAQLALQLPGGQTRRMGGNQKRGPEPVPKGRVGPMKNRPRRDRNIVSAPSTSPQIPARQNERVLLPATRTAISIRPPRIGQVLTAGRIIRKLLLELKQSFWERRLRHEPYTIYRGLWSQPDKHQIDY
jgi:hypothetical protein